MRSGYSTKEIKDVANALKKMGINAKQAGISKSGSLKMKEKKNIYTFSRVGGEIVSLNLDGFPPVKPFNEEDASKALQEILSKNNVCKIRMSECNRNSILVDVSCHDIKFEYKKTLTGYDRDNLTYEEIAEDIREEAEEKVIAVFCEKKDDVIDQEIAAEVRKFGYGDLLDSRNLYSKVLGDGAARMFRFAGRTPSITENGFEIEGSEFSARYKTVRTKRPELFNTAGIERIKKTTESINGHIWKSTYIDDMLKYLCAKPNISAYCTTKTSSSNIKDIQEAEFKVKYDTDEFVFNDTFVIPLEKDNYEHARECIDNAYDKFMSECENHISEEKDKRTKELEEAGLCYKILPYAIYRIVEANNDAVTENMVYNNLYGQKRKRKTNFVEGYTGKFFNIMESKVEEAIRDMKDAGILREVYHINEFNNRFYFLALGEEYRGCLPGECDNSVEQIMSRDSSEWTDFDWIKIIRNFKTENIDTHAWLRLMEVFYNEDVCAFCEKELADLFSAAPKAIAAYLNAADVGPGYSRVNAKIQILHDEANVV